MKPNNQESKFQIIDIQVNEFTYKPVRLTRRQINVYKLLKSGKHSAADISIKLGYSDPRSHIKRLIDKGIPVQSRWIEKHDVRFKIYSIE